MKLTEEQSKKLGGRYVKGDPAKLREVRQYLLDYGFDVCSEINPMDRSIAFSTSDMSIYISWEIFWSNYKEISFEEIMSILTPENPNMPEAAHGARTIEKDGVVYEARPIGKKVLELTNGKTYKLVESRCFCNKASSLSSYSMSIEDDTWEYIGTSDKNTRYIFSSIGGCYAMFAMGNLDFVLYEIID